MIVSPATLQGFQWLRVAGLSFMPVRQHKGRVVCDNFRKRFDETAPLRESLSGRPFC